MCSKRENVYIIYFEYDNIFDLHIKREMHLVFFNSNNILYSTDANDEVDALVPISDVIRVYRRRV